MHFLYPTMLLAALGVAVPIAIHLLNRYRFRVVEWGAMELLRRALLVRARRIELEDLLLLLLRCLVIVLVALALARPVLSPAGGWAGRDTATGAVVVVDASFSMSHRPGVRSRFEQAAERVRQVARTLKPGSPTTLVLLGDRPRVLLRNTGFDPDAFEAALKDAAALPERLDLEAGLEEVRALLDELSSPAKETYLVTDAQSATWGDLSEGARRSLEGLASVGPVLVLPVAAEGSENLAATRFEPAGGLLRRGSVARYDVEVTNFGTRPREAVPVSLLLDGVAVDQRVLDRLEPGRSAGVSLFARFARPGLAKLTAKLGADELPDDNARHAVADVREQVRVLYVRAPAADTQGEPDYLATALTPRPGGSLTVDPVSWLDLPRARLGDYQAVVLANVPDLADEQLRTLTYFVKEGGGLLVFLGDNVQPALYNARLRFEGDDLLPAELGEPRADAAGWPVEAVPHPLSRVLAAIPPETLREARVQRYFPMKLRPTGRAALAVAGTGEPLVAEKALGRGRVVVFAAAADRDWTNMVVEPGLYPLLVHEALTFLGRREHEVPATVSGRLSLPLPARAEAVRSATFQPAGGRPLPSVAPVSRDGLLFAELAVAERPGFYEVRTDPPGPTLAAAVNVDPRESDVRTLAGDALADALQGTGARVLPAGDSVESAVRDGRVGRDLWRELLLAALAVLLVEGALARYFTRTKGANA